MILQDYDKLIFEISSEGHTGYDMPKSEVEEYDLAAEIGELARKEDARLPEVSELQILRHYTALSNRNFGVETGPYPLGSCTMKYNPKINENVAAMDGFANIHPQQDPDTAQGALQLLFELQEYLQEITQLHTVTLQPAAGAHGELAAILAFKAYFESIGEGEQRRVILIPDSAHGTNPATAMVAGYETLELPSTPEGIIDVEAVRAAVEADKERIAGIMITNPSTAGLFETDAKEIVDIVHEAGGLAYYDGANLNAIMGITSPGAMGFDACHLNLHKTFTGPHGGGGPGSGPIGVVEKLAPFLPGPNVTKNGDKYEFFMPEKSFGRIKGNYGNFGVNVRAYTYIRAMGAEGLRRASEDAVLNANYLRVRVMDHFDAPFARYNKNDFVLSLTRHKNDYGVTAKDVGKRLLDYGVHAPTTYFPLIVEECLMVEPTETESKLDLDYVADIFIKIAQEAIENPELVTSAPHNTPVKRLDEATASRNPILKYDFNQQ